MISFVIRGIVFSSGSYIWINYTERHDIDYKEYLGPNWTRSFDKRKAPTLVGNHISWIDIMVNLYMILPCYVARASIKTTPCIGYVADYLNSIYVERVKGDKKNDTAEKIIKYQ